MIAPSSETELATAIAQAKGPLRIRGGGTRPIGHPVTGDLVSTSGLSGITLYEPGALTMVAQSGTPLADIEAALAKEGQRLAFEPMDHRPLLGTDGSPTIGGVVAANVSGPRRFQAGACRDFLLGVRFVNGSGQVIANGGRVMKNVTGYDLVKLMAGSYGTLGILTEVALKVLPNVETEATLVIKGLGVAQGIEALCHAMGSPFDVAGAGFDPQTGAAYLRLEGFESSVTYRTEKLAKHVAGFGKAEVLERCASASLWQDLRDVKPLTDIDGDVWRVSVQSTDAAETLAQIEPIASFCDWGGGLIWAVVPEGTDLRSRMQTKGHATLIRASEATRASIKCFQPQQAPLAAISAGLREKFDPRGILNPGLMT